MNLLDWWFGFVGYSIPLAFLYAVITTQITIVAITVYLHRHSAHRALELHPALKHFFRFWLWVTTGMGTKAWTAVHRKHHAHTETEDDPHSPKIHGLAEIVFKGTEYYRAAADEETLTRYGKGTPDDWLERNVYLKNDKIGIISLAVVDMLLFGSIGIVIWAIQMMWIPFWAAGVINGIGHAWGYRNFECPDAAKNIVPWGIFVGGEELHNNHHTYPNSPKLSVKPWEVDLGWMWIRIFETLGLAKANAVGPVVEHLEEKKVIDIDTTRAVMNDRFRVLANFADEVVKPLVAIHYKSSLDRTSRKLLRKARRIICRHESQLNERDSRILSEILVRFPTLRNIYDQRVALTKLCTLRTGSRDDMLEAFRGWCVAAEESGHEVLRKFVEGLKSYSIPGMRAATA